MAKSKYTPEKCYVCGHMIREASQCVSLGQDKHRHVNCKPGSSNWMATKGKDSEMAQYFQKPTSPDDQQREPKHPQDKNVTAFVGRLKYLAFMHERDRKNPEYCPLLITIEAAPIDATAIFQEDSVLVMVGGQQIDFEPRDTLKRRIERIL